MSRQLLRKEIMKENGDSLFRDSLGSEICLIKGQLPYIM